MPVNDSDEVEWYILKEKIFWMEHCARIRRHLPRPNFFRPFQIDVDPKYFEQFERRIQSHRKQK